MQTRATHWLAAALAAASLGWSPDSVWAGRPDAAMTVDRMQRELPGARVHRENDGRICRVYGRPLAWGASPFASAEMVRQQRAAVFGVDPAELVPGGRFECGRVEQPILYIPESGRYKFTAVYYHQVRAGIPVEGSGLIVLVRNEPGFPAVLVSANLFDLGGFEPDLAASDVEAPARAARGLMEIDARVSQPRQVIWAGTDAEAVEPALAWRFEVERGESTKPGFDRRLIIAEARTGRVLHEEPLILHGSVTGTVQGLATQGFAADICDRELAEPLPDVRVTDGTTITYTDALGQFTIPVAGTRPVTVQTSLIGRHFRVTNLAGPGSALQQSLAPPGVASFLFNPLNTEHERAEVNAYLEANRARDHVLAYSPAYPGVATQVEYEVRVNSGGECDAFWGGSYIVFALASLPGSPNDCPNTAHSTIVHHEFGHQVVSAGGSGQGSYGEGMADVLAVLVTDQPEFSLGHFGDCRQAPRSAINNRQYPCCCEPHFCGQILSGCVWDTRVELLKTHPATYRDIISSLTINSILLHLGSSITPAITIDYLTLDDDNGFLGDGTPHYAQIAAGFGNHNMDAPPLVYLDVTFPDGRPEFVSPLGGDEVVIQYEPVLDALVAGSVQFFVDVGGGFAPATVVRHGDGVFAGVFPSAMCGTTVRYYFTAMTLGGVRVLAPAGAPDEAYLALSAAGDAELIFHDDMESGFGGWLTSFQIPVFTGFWGLVAPLGTVHEGHQAAPAEDSSPAPGVMCWVTQQGTGGGPDQADVDGGPVLLTSPVFDLQGRDALVRYDAWFYSSGAGTPDADVLTVEISNNDGASWTTVENIPGTSSSWQTRQFFVGRFITPTSTMRLRFSTADGIGGGAGASIVEAAIDEVVVMRYTCPGIAADLSGDGSVNGIDLAILLGQWTGAATYSPCPPHLAADLNQDCRVNGLDLAILLGAWAP